MCSIYNNIIFNIYCNIYCIHVIASIHYYFVFPILCNILSFSFSFYYYYNLQPLLLSLLLYFLLPLTCPIILQRSRLCSLPISPSLNSLYSLSVKLRISRPSPYIEQLIHFYCILLFVFYLYMFLTWFSCFSP